MDTSLKLLFMCIGIAVLMFFMFGSKRGLVIFELHFKNGRLDKHKGKIPEKFLREARQLAKHHKMTGTVRAEKSGSVRLHISANVSDDLTQQLRNIFPFEMYELKSVDHSRNTG